MSHKSPQYPSEKGGMELSSKKKRMACLQVRTKKKEIKSSTVSSLQTHSGDSWEIRSSIQGHILSKAQYVVCSPHSIVFVLYQFSPPSLIIHLPMIGIWSVTTFTRTNFWLNKIHNIGAFTYPPTRAPHRPIDCRERIANCLREEFNTTWAN